MSFYPFKPEDLIDTDILTYPSCSVVSNGLQVTGSVYLERPFIDPALQTRIFSAFSTKAGGILSASGPFTSSIELLDAELGGANRGLYGAIGNLYRYYYGVWNTNYTSLYTGSFTGRYRVVVVPEIYFDQQIATGTLVLKDYDNSGSLRTLYDDGRGGIYSGSMSGTLVGNVFYAEGLIVLKGAGLNDKANTNEFGNASSSFVSKPPFGTMTNNSLSIAQGLVAAYALNEGSGNTAFDSSGNGNNATLSIVSPNAWITHTGTYGTALLWSGSATLMTTPSFTSSITSSFTVFTSFTPTALTSANGIVMYPAGSSTGQPDLTYSPPNWDYQFHGVSPAPVTGTQQFLGMYLSSSASDGIYINNTNNNITGLNNPPPYGPFEFGLNGVPGNSTSGIYDFIYIWNRVLSSSEIATLNADPFILYNSNLNWSVSFLGQHDIPVKIFRCRAPAGELNASTNKTYFQVDHNVTSSLYPNDKQIVTPTNSPYITTIGIYDDHFNLVALAKLAQPIKKNESDQILFRLRQDW